MPVATAGVGVEVGDFMPPFEFRTPDGQPFSMSGVLGKWLLLVFLPRRGGDQSPDAFAWTRERAGDFDAVGVKILTVGTGDGGPGPTLLDPDGNVRDAFGLAAGPGCILIDPGFRIVRKYVEGDAFRGVDGLLAEVRAVIERDPARNVIQHAPVLIIPNALPADLCRRLIEVWDTQGNVDSGSMVQRDGKTIPVYNYDHKIRRDHFLQPGPEEEQVKKYIGRRVLPEVRKAFNYAVTRREDFRIACYDASRGGYFRPHRDNTTEGTAHRRFAMSLLLNDDYEGGYLRFPEYGPHQYRPDAGGAVIFSCSLLHEATDVTAGRRFVLLSFFYGEAEAKIREEYNKKTGGQYRASGGKPE